MDDTVLFTDVGIVRSSRYNPLAPRLCFWFSHLRQRAPFGTADYPIFKTQSGKLFFLLER